MANQNEQLLLSKQVSSKIYYDSQLLNFLFFLLLLVNWSLDKLSPKNHNKSSPEYDPSRYSEDIASLHSYRFAHWKITAAP